MSGLCNLWINHPGIILASLEEWYPEFTLHARQSSEGYAFRKPALPETLLNSLKTRRTQSASAPFLQIIRNGSIHTGQMHSINTKLHYYLFHAYSRWQAKVFMFNFWARHFILLPDIFCNLLEKIKLNNQNLEAFFFFSKQWTGFILPSHKGKGDFLQNMALPKVTSGHWALLTNFARFLWICRKCYSQVFGLKESIRLWYPVS